MTAVNLSGLHLELPESYKPKLTLFAAPHAAPGRPTSYKTISVAVEDLAPATQLDVWKLEQLKAMSARIPNMQTKRASTVKIAGKDAPLYEVQSSGPGGIPIYNFILFVISGTRGFTVSATHLAGEPFESARAEFMTILQSFNPAL
jgi:hypothetical protein